MIQVNSHGNRGPCHIEGEGNPKMDVLERTRNEKRAIEHTVRHQLDIAKKNIDVSKQGGHTQTKTLLPVTNKDTVGDEPYVVPYQPRSTTRRRKTATKSLNTTTAEDQDIEDQTEHSAAPGKDANSSASSTTSSSSSKRSLRKVLANRRVTVGKFAMLFALALSTAAVSTSVFL